MNIKKAIKSRGMTMAFIELEAGLPARTLSQVHTGDRVLPDHHKAPLRKVLKKYKINLVV